MKTGLHIDELTLLENHHTLKDLKVLSFDSISDEAIKRFGNHYDIHVVTRVHASNISIDVNSFREGVTNVVVLESDGTTGDDLILARFVSKLTKTRRVKYLQNSSRVSLQLTMELATVGDLDVSFDISKGTKTYESMLKSFSNHGTLGALGLDVSRVVTGGDMNIPLKLFPVATVIFTGDPELNLNKALEYGRY